MNPSLFDGVLVKSNRIIYTPSDFAKANLIHLQEAGELAAQKPHTSKRRNLSSYLFFMVTEGAGELVYGGKSYDLKQGDCVCVDCRREYAHSCGDDLWSLKWVHFYGPNMSAIYEKYMERGGKPVFSPKSRKAIEELLDGIYQAAASESYIRDMEIYAKLTSLLTLLMEETLTPYKADGAAYQNGDSDSVRIASSDTDGGDRASITKRNAGKRQNLQELKEYLDRNYASKITLDLLSEKFFINKFYLTRIFREQFGESVTEYLLQIRITRAKQSLRFTDKSIEQIAHECGMQDANYFSRVFKKVEGVTPGEYRKVW